MTAYFWIQGGLNFVALVATLIDVAKRKGDPRVSALGAAIHLVLTAWAVTLAVAAA